MRIRLSLIAITLIMSIVVISCKKTKTTTKTDEEIQIEKLTGTWVLDPNPPTPPAVTVDNNDPPVPWTGFTLTLGNKTYQTTGSPDDNIWKSSGSWDFGTSVSTLVRDDGVDISVAVTDTSLKLEFDYSASGGRLNGIEGHWVFKMVPQ